jgi:hypothetical protein
MTRRKTRIGRKTRNGKGSIGRDIEVGAVRRLPLIRTEKRRMTLGSHVDMAVTIKSPQER